MKKAGKVQKMTLLFFYQNQDLIYWDLILDTRYCILFFRNSICQNLIISFSEFLEGWKTLKYLKIEDISRL